MTPAQMMKLEDLINQLSDLAIEANIPVITSALVPQPNGIIRFMGSNDVVLPEHGPILAKAGRIGAGLFAAAMAIENGLERAMDLTVKREIAEMTR